MTPKEEYASYFPNWAVGLDPLPARMADAMVRYVINGIPPGHFLTAVLENNLMGALGRADDENRHLLYEYAVFLRNYAPLGCYGSPAAVRDWIDSGGMVGMERKQSAEDA